MNPVMVRRRLRPGLAVAYAACRVGFLMGLDTLNMGQDHTMLGARGLHCSSTASSLDLKLLELPVPRRTWF